LIKSQAWRRLASAMTPTFISSTVATRPKAFSEPNTSSDRVGSKIGVLISDILRKEGE